MSQAIEQHPLEAEELMAYLDGELPADRAAAALAHLQQCRDCQIFADDFRRISQQLLSWEIVPLDSQFGTDIASAWEKKPSETQKTTTSTTSHKRFPIRWAWVGAFAALCLMVGLSTTTYHRSHQTAGIEYFASLPSDSKHASAPAVPASGPVQGKEFDRLEQFAKLQNPPPVKFKNDIDGIPSGPMITRTAGLTLTTKDFDGARARLEEILKRHGGYIGDLNVNTPSGSARGFTATLRVPSDHLDAALADLRKLGRVETESQNGEDVTSQYVDLEARLSNARNTEDRLTALLRDRTGKLSDVLAVENELSRVRGEIERMQAERKTLLHRVEFATISATVNEDYQAQLQVVPGSTWTRLHNAAVDGYRSMVDGLLDAILFLFSIGPTLLLWGAILFFPARLLWKRFRRSKALSREIA